MHGFATASFFPGLFFYFFAFFDSLKPQPKGWGFSLAQKLPTNRAFGPVRRARRGVILNEKGVHHPFLAAFAAWLALCCAKMHGFATASFFPGLFFYFFAFFDSLKPQLKGWGFFIAEPARPAQPVRGLPARPPASP